VTTTKLRRRAEKQTKDIRRRARKQATEMGGRAAEVGQSIRSRATDAGKDVGKQLRRRTGDARRRVGYWVAGEEPPKRRTGAVVAAGVVGATAAFFLDPVSGKRRRPVPRDWVAARFRDVGRRAARTGRGAGAQAYGAWRSATHVGEATPPENDAVLAHKVESEALRGPDVPGERINVNAENGVVVLRGTVQRPEQVDEIERRVRRVNGVRDVRNLLHLEGTPAPMS
jgi:gas vesicle protein